MKKKISLLTIILLVAVVLTGCGTDGRKKREIMPDLEQIRNICNLATLECYYNNVAKSIKEKGEGISHWGEKERKFWSEYSGKVRIGIDLSRIKMDVDDKNIVIAIPPAKILSMDPNDDLSNIIISEDAFFNKNKITSDDVTKALKEAQKELKNKVIDNKSLFASAQDRAKKLIENYIEQIGRLTNTEYNVKWEYIEDDGSNSVAETEQKDDTEDGSGDEANETDSEDAEAESDDSEAEE